LAYYKEGDGKEDATGAQLGRAVSPLDVEVWSNSI